jgi:hypothetical protein
MRARRRRIQRARNRGINIKGEPIAPRTPGGAQIWQRFLEHPDTKAFLERP